MKATNASVAATAGFTSTFTPGSVFTPGGFATMGFGAPAALGAKLARPDRVVVSLVGDGGFGANPSLLYTARERGIAAVWVVMNNNAFGTIAGLEKAHFDTTYGTVFENADGPVVTAFGAIASTPPRLHRNTSNRSSMGPPFSLKKTSFTNITTEGGHCVYAN